MFVLLSVSIHHNIVSYVNIHVTIMLCRGGMGNILTVKPAAPCWGPTITVIINLHKEMRCWCLVSTDNRTKFVQISGEFLITDWYKTSLNSVVYDSNFDTIPHTLLYNKGLKSQNYAILEKGLALKKNTSLINFRIFTKIFPLCTWYPWPCPH